ncbi:MAG: LytTR family DNA-binding domain-containing protein [Erysipelotrichaceae bacterium]
MIIAICDDDALEIAHISALLNDYRIRNNVNLKYKVYKCATDLLEDMRNQYDLLLLDIIMPGFNGIQVAKEIRTFDANVKIIFLTSSPDFAIDSYSVHARDYLLKPIEKDKFFKALDLINAEINNSFEGISIKTKASILRILFSKLEFVEVISKHLFFHMVDGNVYEVFASLSDYEKELLARPEFIKVHRSYIVNLWHMNELTSNCLISFTKKTIPISRLLYTTVRQSYMEHLFIETRIQ